MFSHGKKDLRTYLKQNAKARLSGCGPTYGTYLEKENVSLKKKEINANTSSAAVKVLIPKFRDLAQAIANEG